MILAVGEDVIKFINILTNAGPLTLLGGAIWALATGRVIFPREKEQVTKECERITEEMKYWRNQVERLNQKILDLTAYTSEITKTATKAVQTTKHAVETTKVIQDEH